VSATFYLSRSTPPRRPFAAALLSGHRVGLLAAAPALVLGACDAQHTSDYRGEALLSLRGSVEIADDNHVKGKLVPAIAFVTHGDVHIVDVDVHGEFPADFTLDVYEPPPDGIVTEEFEYPGEPEVAAGYITAVAVDHPSIVPLVQGVGSSGGPCVSQTSTLEDDAGIADGGGRNAPEPCPVSKSWCRAGDQDDCYTETANCPNFNTPFDQCEVTAKSGDPALRGEIWDLFAGLSENYVIAYLRGDAAKRSVVAHELGGGKTGLSAGYHLIELSRESDADDEARTACENHARELAIDRYNEAHGTDYGPSDPETDSCYDESLPCDQAVADAIAGRVRKASAELDCPRDDVQLTVIPHPEDEHIAVRIGKSIRLGGEH
jgi:hypothetical protein